MTSIRMYILLSATIVLGCGCESASRGACTIDNCEQGFECASDGTCVAIAGAADAALSADASMEPDGGAPGPKRIFVSNSIYAGDLKTAGGGSDGLDGADKLCGSIAETAGLGGSWKALLSDTSAVASDRIADVGPWYLVDGVTKIFDTREDLKANPLVPISLTEDGSLPSIGTSGVWTGTRFGGAVGNTCTNWTASSGIGNAGLYNSQGTDWIDVGFPALAGNMCDGANHLYCMEQ